MAAAIAANSALLFNLLFNLPLRSGAVSAIPGLVPGVPCPWCHPNLVKLVRTLCLPQTFSVCCNQASTVQLQVQEQLSIMKKS
eukprot:1055566-Pelagomonas_calceolata.AAC.1